MLKTSVSCFICTGVKGWHFVIHVYIVCANRFCKTDLTKLLSCTTFGNVFLFHKPQSTHVSSEEKSLFSTTSLFHESFLFFSLLTRSSNLSTPQQIEQPLKGSFISYVVKYSGSIFWSSQVLVGSFVLNGS